MRILNVMTVLCVLLVALVRLCGATPGATESGWRVHARPSEAEIQQALDVVRAFAEAVYARDYKAAFTLVRGIDDPEKASANFQQVIRNDIAAWSFRQLSTCQNNVSVLASAVESYARDHDSRYPRQLAVLLSAHDPYLTQLPTCPGHGRYEYRAERQGYRVYCHKDAHAEIGIKGDYPAYASGTGLTLGDQPLDLGFEPQFLLRSRQVILDDWLPDFNILVVRLEENTAIGEIDPFRHRVSRFCMSRKNGRWLVDLYLSNRDMAFVYDFDTWQAEAAIPKQILFLYEIARSSLPLSEEYQSLGELQLRVCESNLRGISLAVEAWSVVHGGAYPKGDGLRAIVPTHMLRIPTCPSGGTYRYERRIDSGIYLVRCAGDRHAAARVMPGFPTVDPINGVRDPRKD